MRIKQETRGTVLQNTPAPVVPSSAKVTPPAGHADVVKDVSSPAPSAAALFQEVVACSPDLKSSAQIAAALSKKVLGYDNAQAYRFVAKNLLAMVKNAEVGSIDEFVSRRLAPSLAPSAAAGSEKVLPAGLKALMHGLLSEESDDVQLFLAKALATQTGVKEETLWKGIASVAYHFAQQHAAKADPASTPSTPASPSSSALAERVARLAGNLAATQGDKAQLGNVLQTLAQAYGQDKGALLVALEKQVAARVSSLASADTRALGTQVAEHLKQTVKLDASLADVLPEICTSALAIVQRQPSPDGVKKAVDVLSRLATDGKKDDTLLAFVSGLWKATADLRAAGPATEGAPRSDLGRVIDTVLSGLDDDRNHAGPIPRILEFGVDNLDELQERFKGILPANLPLAVRTGQTVYSSTDPVVTTCPLRADNTAVSKWMESTGIVEAGGGYSGTLPLSNSGWCATLEGAADGHALLQYRSLFPEEHATRFKFNPFNFGHVAAMPRGAEFEVVGNGVISGQGSVAATAGVSTGNVKVGATARAGATAEYVGQLSMRVTGLGNGKVQVTLDRLGRSTGGVGVQLSLGVEHGPGRLNLPSVGDGLIKTLVESKAQSTLQKLIEDYGSLRADLGASYSNQLRRDVAFELDLNTNEGQQAYQALLRLNKAEAEALQGNGARKVSQTFERTASTAVGGNVHFRGNKLVLFRALNQDGYTFGEQDGKRVDGQEFKKSYHGMLSGNREVAWKAGSLENKETGESQTFYKFSFNNFNRRTQQKDVEEFYKFARALNLPIEHESLQDEFVQSGPFSGQFQPQDDTETTVDIFFTDQGKRNLRTREPAVAMKAFLDVASTFHNSDTNSSQLDNLLCANTEESKRLVKLVEDYLTATNRQHAARFNPLALPGMGKHREAKAFLEEEYKGATGRDLAADANLYSQAKQFTSRMSMLQGADSAREELEFFTNLGKNKGFDYKIAIATLAKLAGEDEVLVHQLKLTGPKIHVEFKDEQDVTGKSDVEAKVDAGVAEARKKLDAQFDGKVPQAPKLPGNDAIREMVREVAPLPGETSTVSTDNTYQPNERERAVVDLLLSLKEPGGMDRARDRVVNHIAKSMMELRGAGADHQEVLKLLRVFIQAGERMAGTAPGSASFKAHQATQQQVAHTLERTHGINVANISMALPGTVEGLAPSLLDGVAQRVATMPMARMQTIAALSNTAPATDSRTLSAELVRSVYQEVLHREPDEEGLQYWTGVAESLKAKGQTDTQIHQYMVQTFAGSPEGIVRQAYRDAFAREGDEAGITYWKGEAMKMHTQGMSSTQIRDTILARFKQSPEGLVRQAFRDARGSEADADTVNQGIADVVRWQQDGKNADAIRKLLLEMFKPVQSTGTNIVPTEDQLKGLMAGSLRLEPGAKCGPVAVIREQLAVLGFASQDPVADEFGPSLEHAVTEFKTKYNLGSDGIVGQTTFAKMGTLLYQAAREGKFIIRPGQVGTQVELLQKALSAYPRYAVAVNGEFGPYTRQCVEGFQAANGLNPPDGLVGQKTLAILDPLVEENTGVQAAVDMAKKLVSRLNLSNLNGTRPKEAELKAIVEGIAGAGHWNSDSNAINMVGVRTRNKMSDKYNGEYKDWLFVHYKGKAMVLELNTLPSWQYEDGRGRKPMGEDANGDRRLDQGRLEGNTHGHWRMRYDAGAGWPLNRAFVPKQENQLLRDINHDGKTDKLDMVNGKRARAGDGFTVYFHEGSGDNTYSAACQTSDEFSVLWEAAKACSNNQDLPYTLVQIVPDDI